VADHPQDDEFDVAPDAEADLSADERAWRSIIDNYGDRVDIDEPPVAPPPAAPPGPASDVPFGGRFGDARAFGTPAEQVHDEPVHDEHGQDNEDDEEQGYEPPEPPPLPTVAPDRGLAWAGVFGSPVILLTCLILSVSIPAWLGYLLVIGFVGGFLYLVFQMPREPRDPWDDGAQV
jgi:hypothetical protein